MTIFFVPSRPVSHPISSHPLPSHRIPSRPVLSCPADAVVSCDVWPDWTFFFRALQTTLFMIAWGTCGHFRILFLPIFNTGRTTDGRRFKIIKKVTRSFRSPWKANVRRGAGRGRGSCAHLTATSRCARTLVDMLTPYCILRSI